MSNRASTVLLQIGPRLALRGAIMIGLLIAAGVFINNYSFEDVAAGFDFTGDSEGSWLGGTSTYFVIASLFTAAGGPRQAVSFFAAYSFGLATGFGLALAATVTGSAICVAAAVLFGGLARNLVRGRVDIAARIWRQHAFSMTLLLRLLPVGSNLFTNLAAGVAGIPFLRFLSGSALGYTPQTLVFALLGAGVNLGNEVQIALSVVLFIASVLVGVFIYARYRKNLRGTEDNDSDGEEITPDRPPARQD